MSLRRSMLESSGSVPLERSISWVADLLTGSLATGLAVTGFALLGFLFLTGRLPLRRGAATVIGAFILFGAPTLAAGLVLLALRSGSGTPAVPTPDPGPARAELPPAQYDPYAGASLRRD